jgi:hypothetical protein
MRLLLFWSLVLAGALALLNIVMGRAAGWRSSRSC